MFFKKSGDLNEANLLGETPLHAICSNQKVTAPIVLACLYYGGNFYKEVVSIQDSSSLAGDLNDDVTNALTLLKQRENYQEMIEELASYLVNKYVQKLRKLLYDTQYIEAIIQKYLTPKSDIEHWVFCKENNQKK